MHANQARLLLKKHRELLKTPKLDHIIPFIERAAQYGDHRLHYGVALDAVNVDEIIKELMLLGYEVNKIPQETIQVLEIKWE